jgi:hypothetical protein
MTWLVSLVFSLDICFHFNHSIVSRDFKEGSRLHDQTAFLSLEIGDMYQFQYVYRVQVF